MFKGWVISIAVAICYTFAANAQSLRGKLVYISSSQPVKLKFGSRIANYSFIDRAQAGLFTIHANKKNLSVSSNARNFRTANLVVTEGSNSHLFILQYKESLDLAAESAYDFSSTEKLNAEAQQLKMVLNNSSARAAFGKSNTYIPEFSSNNATATVPATNGIQTNHATEPATVKLTNEASNASKLEPSAPKTVAKPTNNTGATSVSKPAAKPNIQPGSMKPVVATPAVAKQEVRQEVKKLEAIPTANNIVTDEETTILEGYELLIHLGDSTAWIANNYKTALQFYDSAKKLNPYAAYPRKQIAAVKQLINEQLEAARQQRSEKFRFALADYKTADALRVERKFDDAYKGYSKFLSQLDSANIGYLSSEQYYINQAKDYLVRLQPYLSKPKPAEPAPPPANVKKKKKKRGS
jgi:hypothetical protein